MSTIARPARTTRTPVDPTRKYSLTAGICYLITFVSIPTLVLYDHLKHDQNFVLSPGSSNGVLWGAFLEVIVALAGIGTAVALYPVVKRQNRILALGFVAVRTLEASMIFVGVTSLLTLVHLRETLGAAVATGTTGGTTGGADAGSLVTTATALVGTYNGTFLLGQTLMPCMSALLLGTLMYRSGLVPRVLPLMGLVGAPLLITSTVAVMFGVIDQISAWSGIATVPIALWEFSLGLWLTFKGFKPAPIISGPGPEGSGVHS